MTNVSPVAPTFDQVSLLLSLDAQSGDLVWKVRRSSMVKPGDRAGRVARDGYRTVKLFGKDYPAHRVVWLLSKGEWPRGHIDHIDGNRLNNSPCNLRDVDRKTNNENQIRAHKSSKTGLLGASYHKASGMFQAQISVSNRVKFIGYFATAKEAHAAYLHAKRRLHLGATI